MGTHSSVYMCSSGDAGAGEIPYTPTGKLLRAGRQLICKSPTKIELERKDKSRDDEASMIGPH
jgi:hypothetical protein